MNKDGVLTETKYDDMNRVIIKEIKTKNKNTQEYETKEKTEYKYEKITVHDGKGTSKDYQALKTETIQIGKLPEVSYTNSLGQTVRTYIGELYTDFTYDKMGRVVATYVMGEEVRQTGGKVTCQLYDIAGNVTATLSEAVKKTPAPTPTQTPKPTVAPVTMPPNATKPPVNIPHGYESINLESYGIGGGAVKYYAGLGLAVTDVNSVQFALSKTFKPGDKLHVLVQGAHNNSKGFRSFLATNSLY